MNETTNLAGKPCKECDKPVTSRKKAVLTTSLLDPSEYELYHVACYFKMLKK